MVLRRQTQPRRPRTLIEWDEIKDRAIRSDLVRFRGRAIGRRVKDLLVMGLEAERLGMRAAESDGVVIALAPRDWAGGGLVPVRSLDPAATAANHPPSRALPSLDEAHLVGLEELLDSVGVG